MMPVINETKYIIGLVSTEEYNECLRVILLPLVSAYCNKWNPLPVSNTVPLSNSHVINIICKMVRIYPHTVEYIVMNTVENLDPHHYKLINIIYAKH